MAVGRISGPLLKSNLIRNGIDLAFETDLLYLDVNNQRIGVKNTAPQYVLDVNGTTKTTNLIVTNRADIGNVNIQGNTISSDNAYLNLGTLDNVVYQNKAVIDSIDIEGNVISTNSSNANLEFRPNGTGSVEVFSDMNVDGNIHATGNISADGNITIGDADTDNVTFNAGVASNIIPDANNTYTLGSDPASGGKQWADVWVNNLTTSSLTTTALVVDGIDMTLRQGNIYYVAENGDDTNTGTHQQDPVGTIEYALSLATGGDTIHIYPGVYTENFPLTVPVGVTVKGQGLRSVTVKPTAETRYNDAFLLNGESTIEDLMVTGFYSGGTFYEIDTVNSPTDFDINVGTSPFAHAYVSDGILQDVDQTTWALSGSQANVISATYNHTTGIMNVTFDSAITATAGEKVFVSGLVFSCNSGNRTFPDNGYAFRFATDFEVTTRSPYIRNITVITAGSSVALGTNSADDPRGFNAGDAGKGAYIDGAYATANSREASMLFHSATFICPGVDTISATNGVRIEWLNSFTYFADKSIYAYNSNDGLKGAGQTHVRLSGVTGTFTAGNTITFTSTDSSSVATATIAAVNGDVISIDGKYDDLDGFDTTPASISDGTATATTIENVDKRDFGAEIRMIGSASVYGNYGLYGDGDGVIIYAIGQNLAYIGNGKSVDNDPVTVIQENEVVELNAAKIRYNSVDHKGDFRVGDLFYVNQEDGTVSFVASAINIDLTDGVTFETDGNTTFINGERIDTGNIRISGNTVESLSGDLNFDAFSNQINIPNDVAITGNLDVTGDVTIGGNIVIGDQDTDTIQIVAGINSDLIPDVTSTYSLGSSTNTWANLYVDNVFIDDIEINTNYIRTLISNSDLELRANGTGNIYVPNNDVQIDNNLTVSGTTTLGDTNITGTITHVGDINTGDTTVTGSATVTQSLDVSGAAQFEEILIDDNFITTTTSNADLELRANGTGVVRIPNNNVSFSQDLAVTQDVSSRNVTATGTVSSDSFTISDINIDDNFIETVASNANLELRANGTGTIYVPSNDVQIDNNLTVTGNVTVGNDLTISGTFTADNIDLANDVTANTFSTGDITIFQNVITTTLSNSDLELRANGTGNIVLEEFTISNSTISTPNDLIIAPGSEYVKINSTGALRLPIGTEAQRPGTPESGQIRYNSDLEIFEGYNGTNWIQLHGVIDLDRDTYVTAELTPGANDNIIRFVVQNNTIVDIDSDKLNAPKVTVDDIQIDGNVISTVTADTDLVFRANGTGKVVFDNFGINDNVITNTVSNSVTEFQNTGNGYVKFAGTFGMVLPVGDATNRPDPAYREVGMLRFNSADARVEVYDGVTWVSVAGSSGAISSIDAEYLAVETVLMLG